MTEFEILLKKQVLSFNKNKKQSYVNRLLKEGEIIGLNSILLKFKEIIEVKYIIENKLSELPKDFIFNKSKNKDLIIAYNLIKEKLNKAETELIQLKAIEDVINEINKDLENNLSSMDIKDKLSLYKNKFSNDVQARINSGLCGLKRPGGNKKFSCENPVISETKYCKKHLLKYNPILYSELFKEDK